MILYRVSNYLFRHKIPFLPNLITYFIRFFWSAYIPCSAKIGNGTKLGYGGLGVVIHGDAVIGENCRISQHVTIGGSGTSFGVACIKDNVFIGAGAKIIGHITVGNNSIIGANAVVLDDVPDDVLVAGIPAKHIKYLKS